MMTGSIPSKDAVDMLTVTNQENSTFHFQTM